MEKNEFQKLCDDLAKTLLEKNTRYGNSTRDTFEKYGAVSYLIRLEDKMNRLRTLIKNEDLDTLDESIQDTFLDLAGYCILALRDLNRNKTTLSTPDDFTLEPYVNTPSGLNYPEGARDPFSWQEQEKVITAAYGLKFNETD